MMDNKNFLSQYLKQKPHAWWRRNKEARSMDKCGAHIQVNLVVHTMDGPYWVHKTAHGTLECTLLSPSEILQQMYVKILYQRSNQKPNKVHVNLYKTFDNKSERLHITLCEHVRLRDMRYQVKSNSVRKINTQRIQFCTTLTSHASSITLLYIWALGQTIYCCLITSLSWKSSSTSFFTVVIIVIVRLLALSFTHQNSTFSVLDFFGEAVK